MAPSLDLLRALEHTHAFDPVPLPGYRSSLYVPFERLTRQPCESRLKEDARRSQRTSVIGPVGSGKSSLIEFVLGEQGETMAPLWVSAAHEGDKTLRDPVEFARHMIRQIVRWAREVHAMSFNQERAALGESARTHASRSSRSTETVGVKLASTWIEPSWSREIEETLADPEIERSRSDFVNSLDRLVEFIYGIERTPVVIIDDSDRWLQRPMREREPLLEDFFRDTCRMLAERNWGIVLAVHPEYCTSSGFRTAINQGFLNSQIDVPQLPDPDAIRLLFDERVACRARDADEEARLENVQANEMRRLAPSDAADVFEEGFESILFERYRESDGNLRAVLTVADQALRETIALEETQVTNAALLDAALALGV